MKVNVDPKGLATIGRIWDSIESSPDIVPSFGARLRFLEAKDVNFIPPMLVPPIDPDLPGIDESEEPDETDDE